MHKDMSTSWRAVIAERRKGREGKGILGQQAFQWACNIYFFKRKKSKQKCSLYLDLEGGYVDLFYFSLYLSAYLK